MVYCSNYKMGWTVVGGIRMESWYSVSVVAVVEMLTGCSKQGCGKIGTRTPMIS